MTTETKVKYATSTAITCTLASLASGSVRCCAAVDNSTNLYDDATLFVAVKTSSSTIGSDKACYIYLYGSEDGTNFNISSAEMASPGTDAAITFDSPTNVKGPFPLSCPASSQTYRLIIGSVAAAFGGILPRKWGFMLLNQTNQSLDSTEGNHQKTYTGITYTNG